MDSINDSLAGKVALVTGACGGIGRAICQRVATEGVKLVLVDVDAKGVEVLASSLETETFVAILDVSDAEAIASQHERIVKEFAAIDILVNCAGILSNNKLLTTKPNEWRNVMSVNLDSALYWSQAVVPAMRDNGFGRIINITSFAWKAGGLTAGTAYTASKGGMVSLTFSIAHEVPLSLEAIGLLHELSHLSENPYLFPGTRADRPINDNSMRLFLRKRIPNCVYSVHGFRSTFRDWAEEQNKWGSRSIEACLAHANQNKTEAAYLRSSLITSRREIMESWATFLKG